MKLKEKSNIILKLITMFCILYLFNLPEVLKYSDPNLLFKTNLLTLLDIFVISCLSTFIPCIHYLNKGKKMDYKLGRKICILNSIIICVISIITSFFLVKFYGNYIFFTSIVGSLLFYYINMLFFVEYKASNNSVLNILCYVIIVASFLTIVVIGIVYIRSSIDPPKLRIPDEPYLVEKSGA